MVFDTKRIKLLQVGIDKEQNLNYHYENDKKDVPIILSDTVKDL